MTNSNAALLVVDDNEDNRYTLTRRLNREGYPNLTTATNGREALECMAAQPFVMIPGDQQALFGRGPGDHPGHDIGWNFRHPVARRKIRRIGKRNCGEMRIEDLGDRDGKVASRIARCLVLQMDDNVLDHRNTPVGT